MALASNADVDEPREVPVGPREAAQLAELTAEVAHELINLLGVVLANAQLARSGGPEQPEQDHLVEIERAASEAVEFVQRLSSAAARLSVP